MVEISRRSRRFFFFLVFSPPPWPQLLSIHQLKPSRPLLQHARSLTKQPTNLGHRVAAVLGVAGTLLVRRLDDEADARSGDDDRRGSGDRDAGAVEACASGPGRRRGQARRPDEGGGEHTCFGCWLLL